MKVNTDMASLCREDVTRVSILIKYIMETLKPLEKEALDSNFMGTEYIKKVAVKYNLTEAYIKELGNKLRDEIIDDVREQLCLDV